MTGPLIGSMLENALMFYSYNEARRFFSSGYVECLCSGKWGLYESFFKGEFFLNKKMDSKVNNLALPYVFSAGFFSGVVVSTVTTPIELIKCRMQAVPSGVFFRNSLDCLLFTLRHGGWKGLFRGHASTLMREGPGNAIYFTLYEVIVRAITKGQDRDNISPKLLMLAGSISGMAYWLPMFPADLIKSKIQADTMTNRKPFFNIFKEILRQEGIRGLYKGLGITLVRSVPANACIFYFYESSVRLVNTHNF